MSEGKIGKMIEKTGNLMVDIFHTIGLFVIGATEVWSAAVTYLDRIQHRHATLHDILLF